jgi:cobalt transporter subunit CbtB
MSTLARAARLAFSNRALAPLAAAILGIALLYLAGFAQADALHDGAHDARHSANFPCH